MTNDDQKVILEHFDSKFSMLLENIDVMIDQKLKPIANDVNEIKEDIHVVKSAVQETNKDTLELRRRLNNLEAA